MIHFILGGARSGKSRYAEQLAQASNLAVSYIATAQAYDAEMHSRIAHHQQQRPQDWHVIEEPIELVKCLQSIDRVDHVILVDCLTLWVSNLLMCNSDAEPDVNSEAEQPHIAAFAALLTVLPTLKSTVILVSNETGLGVVPMGQLSRRFVDESGRLHQQLGQIADQVVFCVAGFPMILKGATA